MVYCVYQRIRNGKGKLTFKKNEFENCKEIRSKRNYVRYEMYKSTIYVRLSNKILFKEKDMGI